jgi:hypothetical protein
VIITPVVSQEEAARRFPDHRAIKPYLRLTAQPAPARSGDARPASAAWDAMRPAPSQLGARDRLLLAFANLASYGIAAHHALQGDAADSRCRVRANLLARNPHAIGSYVFWTRADDARFGEHGGLQGDLILHCSDHDVVTAVRAACDQVGLYSVAKADGPAAVIPAPSAGTPPGP